MRKILLICSAVSLIYGNCVWGMDSDDEMDWEPTAEQEWPVKADKSMTRLERQKRDLQRLHEQFEQNNQSNKPELQELRKNSLVQERRKIFEQGDSRQEVISGSEKMTIAEYQQALKTLQEKLNESAQRENAQKAKIRELAELLENVKQRLQQAKDGSPKQKSSQNKEEKEQSEEKKNNNQRQSELINLQREKIAKYESALQKLQQQLNEEREKTKLAEEKVEELRHKLENVKLDNKTPEIEKTENQDFIFNSKQLVERKTASQQPQDQLFQAVQQGNLSDISNAIKNGADINGQDENGNTPLHWAAKSGNLENIKYLITTGAKINIKNKIGNAPLRWAAWSGNLEVVKYFVELGSDVNLQDKNGNTPIHEAAESGTLEMMEYFVDKKANIHIQNKNGESPLYVACKSGKFEIVKYLVEHGADISGSMSNSVTSLFVAAQNGHLEIVKYLVERGADINKPIINGVTSLFIAAQNGHLEIVKYLVEHGADINTSLFIASANGHLEIVEYLVEHGADINKPIMSNGVTSLFIAAQLGHLEIVKYLVEHGADVRARLLTLTPLYIPRMIQVLPTLANNERKKYQDIVNYLESQEAKTEGIDTLYQNTSAAKNNSNSNKSVTSVPKLKNAQQTFNPQNTSNTTQTTSMIPKKNNLNTTQNQYISEKPTIITMSINGKKAPVLRGNDFKTNSEASFENDIEGRLFVIGDQTSEQNEIQSIIDSLDLSWLDQDPIQKERKIRDDIIRNKKGLSMNDKDSWNAVAKVIGKRIFIYHFFQGFVHGFYEYGKEFSSNGTRRICLDGYPESMKYKSFREAVSIDGKVVPIMFCSPDLLSTLQTDIKGRLFRREDKGSGWKTYLNQCAMNSLELTDRENASIPTHIRENAHANGGLLADDVDSWEVIANTIKRRILVYEQQQECIQGFYEYGKKFSQNGTKRVCLEGVHYQKLVENNQNISTSKESKIERYDEDFIFVPGEDLSLSKLTSALSRFNTSQDKVSSIQNTMSSGIIRMKTTPNRVNQPYQKLVEIDPRENNQNTLNRITIREQQPKTQNITKQTIMHGQPQQKASTVNASKEEHSINPLLIKYAPAMGQLEAIAGAKPSTPPQDSKALLKRFAEVLEVDESMLRYEDMLGQVRLIDISDLIRASLLNSDLNGQLIQTFMNSCSKKLVSIGIDPHWLSKPSNDQSAKAFNWIRSQVNKGIREYKFDTSQRALAKRKLIAARPWNDNSEITEKSITEVINKVTNQLQPPDPKYIGYAKALGLLEAIAGAKPSTPPPSHKSLLKRFADILGIDANLLICNTGYYKSGICFRNMEEQIILNQATSTSSDEMISTLYNNYSRELARIGIYTIHYGVPSKEAFNVLCSQAKQGITGYKFDTSPEAIEKRRAIALRPWDNI